MRTYQKSLLLATFPKEIVFIVFKGTLAFGTLFGEFPGFFDKVRQFPKLKLLARKLKNLPTIDPLLYIGRM